MKEKQIIQWGGGVLAVLFLLATLLPGAIRPDHKASESGMGKAVPTTREEEKRMEAELRKAEKLCRACYLSAEKVPSAYIGQEDIGQKDIDAMEDALCGAGYCVVNSDTVYPEYLENADALRHFWCDVTQSRDAAVSVWNILSDGSICCPGCTGCSTATAFMPGTTPMKLPRTRTV